MTVEVSTQESEWKKVPTVSPEKWRFPKLSDSSKLIQAGF
jgi:hypothetical protein